jgi:hypothetical protein
MLEEEPEYAFFASARKCSEEEKDRLVLVVVVVVDVVVVGGIQAGPYSIIVNPAFPLIVAVSIHPSAE